MVAAVVVVVMVMVVLLPMVMVMVIFGFRKKKIMGSDDWHILLSLNPHMLLREAPKK